MAGFQFGAVGTAHAADAPSDLTAVVSVIMHNQMFADVVCNSGPSDVKSFTTSMSNTNYEVDFTMSLPSQFGIATAFDTGSFDENTNVWTGLMEPGQCVMLGTGGTITGDVGETIVHDFTITQSVLGDDTVVGADDGNSANNTVHNVSSPIVPASDIVISTRLKTSGDIQSGSTVNYEVTMTNEGVGDYFQDGATQMPLGLYFIMPPGSTLGTITDQEPGDNISVTTCGTNGPSSNLGPGAAPYPGIIAGCNFSLSGVVAPGQSYSFNVSLTAGANFASGSTGVWAIADADEPDVMLFQVLALVTNDMFANNSNNIKNLVYDNSTLQATVVRCPGQAETTTSGSGCFRVSFNKDIPVGEFDAGDINLDGKGTISSFTQIGDNLWEVNVSGIAQGATLSLVLNADSIRDFSYVANQVQVLGENTIRFAVATPTIQATGAAAGNATTGTLPATGAESNLPSVLVLLILGFALLATSKIRHLQYVHTE